MVLLIDNTVILLQTGTDSQLNLYFIYIIFQLHSVLNSTKVWDSDLIFIRKIWGD